MAASPRLLGAATSPASVMVNDNLSLKDVLRGAVTAVLTAGLTSQLSGGMHGASARMPPASPPA